jgi:hypothetical protein
MPNLPMHVYLANQVAKRLDWECLTEHPGSLFLGSTAPDMRAMTKWPRERTHFTTLAAMEVGGGPRAMFRQYPGLADYRSLSPATQAFILGYICHLAGDEVWVAAIYRPCFDPPKGAAMVADSRVEAHIWDRALQLDMDRKMLPEVGGLIQAAETTPCQVVGAEVGFLDPQVLEEWREWVGRFVVREFSWERLRRSLNRIFRGDEEVQRAVDVFIQHLPGSLERVYERIPRERIDAYQQRVVDETLAQAQEFWGGV